MVCAAGRFMFWGFPMLFVLVFLRSFWRCNRLALGGVGQVSVLLVRLFVSFLRVGFCPFPLHLGVGRWLRFVIVALPGLSVCSFACNVSAKSEFIDHEI